MGQLQSITHLLLNNNEPGLGNRYERGSWGRDVRVRVKVRLRVRP